MLGHGIDDQKLRLALESVRRDIVAAVHAWREKGGSDDDLALFVDGREPGTPHVSTTTRKQLELTIEDFDPTIAIEFARHIPGQAPAVVDLHRPGSPRRLDRSHAAVHLVSSIRRRRRRPVLARSKGNVPR